MKTYTDEELAKLLESERNAMRDAILCSCKCKTVAELQEYAKIGREITQKQLKKEENIKKVHSLNQPYRPRRSDLSQEAEDLMKQYKFDIFSSVMGYLGKRKPRSLETTIKRYIKFKESSYPWLNNHLDLVKEIITLCWEIKNRGN